MLEIAALFALGKSIIEIVKSKGLKPLKYIIIMVLMWFGFQLIATFLASLIFEKWMLIYLIAVGGAVLGGYLSYNLAKNAKSALSKD